MEYVGDMNLQPELRILVNEIEALTKSPIRLRARTDDDLHVVADASLPICDCNMVNGKMDVSIALPAEFEMPEHTLYHELLHAHRNICLSIPRLAPRQANPAGYRLACGMDNDVEHLFIIPEEIRFAPQATGYWHQHYDQKITTLAAEKPVSPMDKLAHRNSLLSLQVITSICLPEWGGAAEAQAVIASHKYAFEADTLLSKVRLAIPSKVNCLSAFFRFSKLPPEMFCTSRFLVAEGRIDYLPLPQPQ